MAARFRSLVHLSRQAVAGLLIGMVRGYQKLVSPWLGPRCRFHPSCSEYMVLSIRKHGPVWGTCRGLWRICKCNPFHPGGVDLP